jgi:hypothetical protein
MSILSQFVQNIPDCIKAAEERWSSSIDDLPCTIFVDCTPPHLVRVYLFQTKEDIIWYEIAEVDLKTKTCIGGQGGECDMILFRKKYRDEIQNVWTLRRNHPTVTFELMWPLLVSSSLADHFFIDQTIHRGGCRNRNLQVPKVVPNDLVCSHCHAPIDIEWKRNVNSKSFHSAE